MKKLFCMLLSAVMVLSLAACGQKNDTPTNDANADADPDKVYEMKCSTFVNSGAPEMEQINDFVNAVSERTDGHVKITVYPGEQLGGYEQTFEETMRGTIEFGINSASYSYSNDLSAVSIPALYSNFDDVQSTLSPGSAMYTKIDSAMDSLNLKFLGFYVGGFYNTILNVDVPEGYADPSVAKSTLIRVPLQEVSDMTVAALNFRTASLPGSELYSALETGIVDGCVGLDNAFVLSAFSDVVKNIIENKVFLSCDFIFMNKELFESLPAEYQTAIEECAADFQQACIDHQRELEDTIQPQLEAKGITMIPLTDEELAANFDKIREDVWPWCTEQFGEDFMNSLKADVGIAD